MISIRLAVCTLLLSLMPSAVTLAQETEEHPQLEQPAAEQGPFEPEPEEGEPEADVDPLPALTEDPEEATEQEAVDEEVPEPAIRTGKPGDPCKVRSIGDEPRLDRYRREIFETLCETAARFDSFFGSRRFDEEARRTHGRVGLRVVWDEHDKLDLDGRLRFSVDFPNLDNSLRAFLGREDRGEFVTGVQNELDFLPTFFEREGRQEWLLGLGYTPLSSDRSSLDFDIGVDASWPVDPFARTRYRRYWIIGDDNLLRARQSIYYSDNKGVGFGTRVDFERPIGTKTLARLSGNIIFDDETRGGDWDSGVTMYHGFTPNHAIAWFVGINGETGRDVPIQAYGTRFTYRQRMLREWFFGELITGVTWPRDRPEDQRKVAYHIGFGFEIQFSGEDLGIGRRP
jgi:hypothetical protein